MREMIRLLGISASPRKNGNSLFLLDQALEAARRYDGADVSVDRVDFCGKQLSPCLACYGCIDSLGRCIVPDDFQAMAALWLNADAILYSVPVFAMAIPAQLKCFFDRLANSLVFNKEESSKKLKAAGTIAQGMHFAAGQEAVIREISNLSMMLGCVPVAGDAYNGVRGWTCSKLSRSTYKKCLDADDEPTKALVDSARGLVVDLLDISLILRTGARACMPILAHNPAYRSVVRRITDSG